MRDEPRAGVLVTQRHPGYKDIPGVRYHYPKKRYKSAMEQLIGAMVLMYEPRRSGRSPTSSSGGRSAFTAVAYVEKIWDDPDDVTHAYAGLRHAMDFHAPVHIQNTAVSAKALQSAILPIPFSVAGEIVAKGLSVPAHATEAGEREGLADIADLMGIENRPIEQVVSNRRVRDASFRFNVVEQAYNGRCALTGIRMTNGFGRAEADAAHIRPVSDEGPDTVRNGIALMKSLHWAFDRGLISLSNEGLILTVDRGIDESVLALLRPDRKAMFPTGIDKRPHASFLEWHRANRFKGAA